MKAILRYSFQSSRTVFLNEEIFLSPGALALEIDTDSSSSAAGRAEHCSGQIMPEVFEKPKNLASLVNGLRTFENRDNFLIHIAELPVSATSHVH